MSTLSAETPVRQKARNSTRLSSTLWWRRDLVKEFRRLLLMNMRWVVTLEDDRQFKARLMEQGFVD